MAPTTTNTTSSSSMPAAENSFRETLRDVAQRYHEHENNEILKTNQRIRHALAWLTEGVRPLTAGELWLAVEIGAQDHGAGVSDVENGIAQTGRDCGDGKLWNGEFALSELRMLMGSLVQVDEDDRVSLVAGKEEVGKWLASGDEEVPAAFAFEDENEAHQVVGQSCLLVCASTSSQLCKVQKNSVSTLVAYSWTNWARHLMLSGWVFQPGGISNLMEVAIKRVLDDLLGSLVALEKKLTCPIDVHRRESRHEMAGRVKRAQEPLRQAMELIMALDDVSGSTCERLRVVHGVYEKNAPSNPEAALSDIGFPKLAAIIGAAPQPSSAIDCLDIDVVLSGGANVFSASQRHHVNGLAELVRALRRLLVGVSDLRFDGAIHGSETAANATSVLDVLFYSATFVECLVCHPFRFADVFLTPTNPYEGRHEGDDGLREISESIMTMVWLDKYTMKSQAELAELEEKKSRLAVRRAYIAPHIGRSAAWTWAMQLEDPSHVRRKNPRPLNEKLPLSPEGSVFGSWAEHVKQLPGLQADVEVLDIYLPSSIKQRMVSLWNFVQTSELAISLCSWAVRVLTGGTTSMNWIELVLSQSFLRHGLAHFTVMFLIAFGLYRIRTLYVPWFANGLMYDAPLENLQLAWAEPGQLVAKHLSSGFIWRLFMWSVKLGCDTAGLTMLAWILGSPDGPGRLPVWAATMFFGSPRILGRMELGYTVMKIGFLFWGLMMFDYISVRALEVTSVLVAYFRMFTGSEKDRSVLLGLLWEHWDKILLHWWSVLGYARRDVAIVAEPCGILLKGAIRNPVVALGIFAPLIATYHASFEMAWILVSWARLAIIGLPLVAVFLLWITESFLDPLGLYASTMTLRRTGQAAEDYLKRKKKELPITNKDE